jgi:hypothetical protein
MGWMATVLFVCGGCSAPPQDDVVRLAEDGRVWCYRTLADADCFTRPERGAEARLIAIGLRRSFVPAPAPDEATVRVPRATPVGERIPRPGPAGSDGRRHYG